MKYCTINILTVSLQAFRKDKLRWTIRFETDDDDLSAHGNKDFKTNTKLTKYVCPYDNC